jgi:Rad3-related DNA helicase
VLSNDKKSTVLSLPSPFDRDNLFCAAYTNVSTRYEDREKNSKRILSVIAAVLRAKKGNYMIYFPSYGYMQLVYDKFVQKYPKVHTMIQRNNMSSSERQNFIDFFSDDTSEMRVGFCVLGGLFSEGIDLPGNRLIGTVIVGVGLPGISSEQNIIKEYYDFCGENGFDFAYTFPGMNNVLQAAGRVIRGEKDRGVVVFVDDRYSTEKYRRLLPERFSGMDLYDDAVDLSEDIDDFWKKN